MRKMRRRKKKTGFLFAWILCFCVLSTAFGSAAVRGSSISEEDAENESQPETESTETLEGANQLEEATGDESQPETEFVEAGNQLKPEITEDESQPETESVEAAEDEKQPEALWMDSAGQVQSGTFEEAIKSVVSNGTVTLVTDVLLDKPITISASMIITSNDPQNPCTIRTTVKDTDDRANTGRIFTVRQAELRLQNIILDGGKDAGAVAYHPLICVDNGVVRMLSGAVLQNAQNASQSLCGGGVNIRLGMLYLYDGARIANCKAHHGGGVEINSRAGYSQAGVLMAGEITDCEADDGGGVYVNIGIFQMQGGEIKGCRSTKEDTGGQRTGGGGIYVRGAGQNQNAAVLIAGGRIAGNTAVSNGGGILIQSGYGQLEMRDGILEDNTANCGGGISVVRGTLMLYGGTVTGNKAMLYGGGVLGSPDSEIKLQGSPKVYDNYAGDMTDRFDNLYLDGAEDDSAAWATAPIRLVGALGDGVKLGMSRWVRPDETDHPYREMIVPGNNYTIAESDFARLCEDQNSSEKELYADNMEKYAFIPYDGKIVMVLAVDVALDRESLALENVGDAETLYAAVSPENALIRDVTWESSDETIATVDAQGKVTAVSEGEAVITATTVAPYHASASCTVTVGSCLLETEAKNGTVGYLPASADGLFAKGVRVTLQPVPEEGYRLKEDSLCAWKTDEPAVSVPIEGNVLIMPGFDVTATAEFEPIPPDKPNPPQGGGNPPSPPDTPNPPQGGDDSPNTPNPPQDGGDSPDTPDDGDKEDTGNPPTSDDGDKEDTGNPPTSEEDGTDGKEDDSGKTDNGGGHFSGNTEHTKNEQTTQKQQGKLSPKTGYADFEAYVPAVLLGVGILLMLLRRKNLDRPKYTP